MPVTLFYSYAREDEALRDELEKHLSPLRRQGIISSWHDRRIQPRVEWAQAIDDQLNAASVILFLISPDFLASDYCYGREMRRALERHEAKKAIVIPVLFRAIASK
ncbi:hypothetical protein KSZ_06140 [Dictyobacter formicarum]|uniref:TIR domain-containing protein n=1 Tax=Dictyobacter formicarum TaxID=2778368 RepID=A0ABQ3VB18_9CHLR|nr:hypothetical protein KSZ_06140 [Dictyobacter formicarum]